MRQKNHLQYAEIMSRMRLQMVNEEDAKFFKSRLIPGLNENEKTPPTIEQIAKFYAKMSLADPKIMALFPTNDEVAEFNKIVSKCLKLDIITIEAKDSHSKFIQKNKTLFERPCKFF